jgi:hypothetical protein
VPRALDNGVLSSMQKQTQKRLKSGLLVSKLFHGQFPHLRVKLLPDALASVSFEFSLVRVRVQNGKIVTVANKITP